MTAFSRRTQNKDSFAAPKILPLNDFLHFAPCAFARFDRRPALRFGGLNAPRIRAPAETRMNARFPPAHDRPKTRRHVHVDTLPAHETWRTSLT